MPDASFNERSAPEEERDDGQVVLAVPRRAVTLGVGVAVVLALSFGAGVVTYQLLNQKAQTDTATSRAAVLPPPVTFVPPTTEPPQAADRVAVSPDDDPAVGPVDAPILMIEFSDYQCRYCGQFARETLHPLLERYGEQVRFVYRDFVVLGPLSMKAARAAECANDQGAFWEYYDEIFANQTRLSEEWLLALAERLSLALPLFKACFDDPASEEEVATDSLAGLNAGVRGTPTFFINGRIVVGANPLETFAAVLDEELALQGTAP